MNFMNRKPAPVALPSPDRQHPAIGAHIEYVTGIEEQLHEARETIAQLKAEVEALQRDNAVERRERRAAQAARDEFHTRAIASETAVNNAAAILLDEVRKGREFAASRPVETQGAVAVDLDQMAANINGDADAARTA
jgi:FtsZ-binding cell division protein ZapB